MTEFSEKVTRALEEFSRHKGKTLKDFCALMDLSEEDQDTFIPIISHALQVSVDRQEYIISPKQDAPPQPARYEKYKKKNRLANRT